MSINSFSYLERNFIKVNGIDSFKFLQSLVTNNLSKVTNSSGIYTLLLTPQGKFFQDMFITLDKDNNYLIEVDIRYRDELVKKLLMYKLRAQVNIEKEDSLKVIVAWGETISKQFDLSQEGECAWISNNLVILDPRLNDLGVRIYSKEPTNSLDFLPGNYDEIRINLGVAEGNKDLIINKSFPLHFGLDKLNAIDYKKGCYVGQEVISRTTYRGTLRKKIFIAHSKNELFSGSEFSINQDQTILICSTYKNQAIALVSCPEQQEIQTLFKSNKNETISLIKPKWMQ